jgi:hypothetical protein
MGKSINSTSSVKTLKHGNIEANAMDAETLLSMKSYLLEKLLASSIDLPTYIYDSKGKQIQKWDGILLSGDTLSLRSKAFNVNRKGQQNRRSR